MSNLEFQGDLTIARAQSIKAEMQQGLSEQMDNAVIELDLAKVAEMDGAGLQLLLTFWHAAAEFGCSVMLRNVLPSLRDKLLVLDVADRFTMIEDRGQA